MITENSYNVTGDNGKVFNPIPEDYDPYKYFIKKGNYLKYFRVVSRFMCDHYDITPAQLDLIIYLYDVEEFTRKELYVRYSSTWKSNLPFARVLENGLFYRLYKMKLDDNSIYTLSDKAKEIVEEFYKVLEGKEVPFHLLTSLGTLQAKYKKNRPINLIVEIENYLVAKREEFKDSNKEMYAERIRKTLSKPENLIKFQEGRRKKRVKKYKLNIVKFPTKEGALKAINSADFDDNIDDGIIDRI
jgi:hypothetical protein